jgi:hypothetical protein
MLRSLHFVVELLKATPVLTNRSTCGAAVNSIASTAKQRAAMSTFSYLCHNENFNQLAEGYFAYQR